MNVARRKAIDQPRQQLQVDVLDALRIRKNHVALGRSLAGFVQCLVQRQMRQDFVETIDQAIRIGLGPQLNMFLALLSQVLKNATPVMGERRFVIARVDRIDGGERRHRDFARRHGGHPVGLAARQRPSNPCPFSGQRTVRPGGGRDPRRRPLRAQQPLWPEQEEKEKRLGQSLRTGQVSAVRCETVWQTPPGPPCKCP